MEEVITKQEAKEANLTHYFTGKPCKNGHVAKRFTRCSRCTVCRTVEGASLKRKQYKEKYYIKNKVQTRKKSRVYYRNNRERILKREKAYYLQNKEKVGEYKKKYAKEVYYERLRETGRGSFYTMTYYCNKKKRCPKWSNLNEIKFIYKNCPKDREVDHIIPLHGELISGLHVHNNLQYLTKSENTSKGNKFEPYIEINEN